MKIVGLYSFKGGRETLEARYSTLLSEVYRVISGIDSSAYKTKVSKESSTAGQMLYSPVALNKAFKVGFRALGWQPYRVECNYPRQFYLPNYDPPLVGAGAFREMDFIKARVGVEVQFGKYSFMVYNVCAKMTIFHKQDVIDVGIEIVPIRAFAAQMSSGVSYFEQFVWDLEMRGVAEIDIPVLILGISG